jgi:hypothetical protein
LQEQFRITEDAGASATALGYNAAKALLTAVSSCPKGGLDCMTTQLRKPHEGYLLGFGRWASNGRGYPIVLKRVNGRTLERIEPTSEKGPTLFDGVDHQYHSHNTPSQKS